MNYGFDTILFFFGKHNYPRKVKNWECSTKFVPFVWVTFYSWQRFSGGKMNYFDEELSKYAWIDHKKSMLIFEWKKLKSNLFAVPDFRSCTIGFYFRLYSGSFQFLNKVWVRNWFQTYTASLLYFRVNKISSLSHYWSVEVF